MKPTLLIALLGLAACSQGTPPPNNIADWEMIESTARFAERIGTKRFAEATKMSPAGAQQMVDYARAIDERRQRQVGGNRAILCRNLAEGRYGKLDGKQLESWLARQKEMDSLIADSNANALLASLSARDRARLRDHIDREEIVIRFGDDGVSLAITDEDAKFFVSHSCGWALWKREREII